MDLMSYLRPGAKDAVTPTNDAPVSPMMGMSGMSSSMRNPAMMALMAAILQMKQGKPPTNVGPK